MNPISDEITNAVDGAAIAADQTCRETGPAIGFGADAGRLRAARIDRFSTHRGIPGCR